MGQIKYSTKDIRRTHELAKELNWEVKSVSIEKAAEILKLSRRSIYLRIASGKLNTKKAINSQRVILDEFFEDELELATSRVKEIHKRKQ